MHAFNQSLQYDKRMHAADIRGSVAYAKALARVGILTSSEEGKIVEGLQAVEREWESGQVWRFFLPTNSTLIGPDLVRARTRRRRYPHRQ